MKLPRWKLTGQERMDAMQAGHLRRMDKCAYGAYNDYKLCDDCGKVLDPCEACGCVDPTDFRTKVKVICWDGIEYVREATGTEIIEAEKSGCLAFVNDKPIFDFS